MLLISAVKCIKYKVGPFKLNKWWELNPGLCSALIITAVISPAWLLTSPSKQTVVVVTQLLLLWTAAKWLDQNKNTQTINDKIPHFFPPAFAKHTHTQTKMCVSVSSAPSSMTQAYNEKVWMTVCVLLPTLSPSLPSRLLPQSVSDDRAHCWFLSVQELMLMTRRLLKVAFGFV